MSQSMSPEPGFAPVTLPLLDTCPYCAAKACFGVREHNMHDVKVVCTGCGAEGPLCDVDDGRPDEYGRNFVAAAAAWNRRAPLSAAALSKLGDALMLAAVDCEHVIEDHAVQLFRTGKSRNALAELRLRLVAKIEEFTGAQTGPAKEGAGDGSHQTANCGNSSEQNRQADAPEAPQHAASGLSSDDVRALTHGLMQGLRELEAAALAGGGAPGDLSLIGYRLRRENFADTVLFLGHAGIDHYRAAGHSLSPVFSNNP
ncbi:hypothetical protein F6X40_27800 [Paraburkholderia sp. UCT31]|uniref:hypothetical protein n=1 Tax=Paraburkholderia sp. UCT31 TaxID=2615209 RepID=UPI001655319F|nr:hypothetical protein [Paraburkholderia sp. UCT31]MBC8740444.1 hypothetical protein [Paraburkholderia sp. UCT31]